VVVPALPPPAPEPLPSAMPDPAAVPSPLVPMLVPLSRPPQPRTATTTTIETTGAERIIASQPSKNPAHRNTAKSGRVVGQACPVGRAGDHSSVRAGRASPVALRRARESSRRGPTRDHGAIRARFVFERRRRVQGRPADPTQMVPIARIRLLNPRARSKAKLSELVKNIAATGLKKPITVAPREDEPGTRPACSSQ
jgi:hypothetical protein